MVFWGEFAEVKACDEPRALRQTVTGDSAAWHRK